MPGKAGQRMESWRLGQQPAPRQGIQIFAKQAGRSAVQDRAPPKLLTGSQALLKHLYAGDIGRGFELEVYRDGDRPSYGLSLRQRGSSPQ